MTVHEKMWENFVLSLDFKISKGCNSGVFFRTCSLTPGAIPTSGTSDCRITGHPAGSKTSS